MDAERAKKLLSEIQGLRDCCVLSTTDSIVEEYDYSASQESILGRIYSDNRLKEKMGELLAWD